MERRTFTEMIPKVPDGTLIVENVLQHGMPRKEKHLMVGNDTRWEELEMELQRIESGKCMLCERVSESLVCERCVPRGE